ncbi:MAG TPA: arginase family protein [Candidatus Dormibacteraeota bacterium]|nr:arginase family protein [Candidatus Dormibacteraeota bacterium]
MIDLRGLAPWGGLPAAPCDRARTVIAGIPYDGSAVYRRGAARAPAELRRLSAALPPVDERGRRLQGLTVHDLGDLSMGASVEVGWPSVAERLGEVPSTAFLTVLGGDHCSAIPVLAAQARRHPDLAVLWVDAHPDLCDHSRGGRWTCGCALRRSLEVAGLAPGAVALAGCRDFDPEEVDFVRERGVAMVTAWELATEPAAVGRLCARLEGRPVHLSLDIDALDPAFAPGTEIASAAGLSTRQALQLLDAVARAGRLVGMDVCEVAPPLDHADITVLAALKLIFETWARVAMTDADR